MRAAIRLRCLVLVIAISVLCGPVAAAAEGLPCDTDGNGRIAADELAGEILDYLEASGTDSAATVDDIRDAAFVYDRWGGDPLTVTDSSGATHTLYRPLKRMVVFNSDCLEVMRTVGLDPSRVAGVSKYTLEDPVYFPEYQDTENIGSIWSPDIERVVSLRPDAVFLYWSCSQSSNDQIQEKLESVYPDLPVFRFDCFYPSSYVQEVGAISRILGNQKRGSEFIGFYTGTMDDIRGITEPIPENDRTAVYLESWDSYKSAAEGSGYHEKIVLAGGRNIFADEPAEYPQIDPEAVITRQPEVVVKVVGAGDLDFGGYGWSDRAPFADLLDELVSRPAWKTVPAVRDDRVHIIHTDLIGGPQHFVGIAYLARWFYPEKFTELNPTDIQRIYLTRYQGIDPACIENSIFLYPSEGSETE
ncbi:MAG: ABC transporter substrate-binding protein [Methanomicrobiales archaeon]